MSILSIFDFVGKENSVNETTKTLKVGPKLRISMARVKCDI